MQKGATQFDKSCHALFDHPFKPSKYTETGQQCKICNGPLHALYCEEQLYMVKCARCGTVALVKANNPQMAARLTLASRGEIKTDERCKALGDMLDNYQNVIVPRYRERAERAEIALAFMWYAYENKDPECPHEYEQKAVSEAERILGKWEDVMPGMMKECRAWND